MIHRHTPTVQTDASTTVIGALLLLFIPIQLVGQAPGTISFQGRLTDTGGTPTNTTTSMTFKLYKGSTNIWTETHPSVTVEDGIFDVILGETSLLDTVRFDTRMELGIAVGGDPEISPRIDLASAAFARALPGFSAWLVLDAVVDSSYNVLGGAHINEISPGAHGATISGGGGVIVGSLHPNQITGDADFATIGGGRKNTASGESATIGGGSSNDAVGQSATIAGGRENKATFVGATVAGGNNNVAGGLASFVGAGSFNHATGILTTVPGGDENLASGSYSTVGGGRKNAARGQYSFAAGFNARPHHDGSFVWGDRSVTGNGDSLITTGVNQFLIRATGGVGIGTNDPGSHSLAINDSDAGGISGASLEVDNNSTGGGITAHFETSGTDATIVIDQDGTGDHIRTFDNGNLRFRVADDGDVTADGTFTGGMADLAEAVDVEGRSEEYEAGDVLVVSTSKNRSFAISQMPYSDLVAGVHATKPGVLLTDRGIEETLSDRVPMGVVGIIPTKVTTENGPIRRGDLLVTSSTPGHAMKGDRSRLDFGMVLGKALEPFDGEDKGMIEVLVLPR